MALSIEQLKSRAANVVEDPDTPTHVGTGQQITTTEDDGRRHTTIVNGDNHGGIRQTFRR